MLLPAALYKNEILTRMQEYYYTDDMMYYTGYLGHSLPSIEENSNGNTYHYAIVTNEGKLIGYFAYTVDWYSSSAYNFGLFSFDRGNILVGRDVFNKLEELVNILHRVEWRAVGGNPACRGYDNFIKKHNGKKHILKDSIRDQKGKYHDDIIYEIVK